MALPHLLKYLYNFGTDEAIRRGKKIQSRLHAELLQHDDLSGNIVFRVKDDMYYQYYKVRIAKYANEKMMAVSCTCPADNKELCRHQAAALLRLQEMVDKNMLLSTTIQYDQIHTVAKVKNIDVKMLRMLSSQSIFSEAEDLVLSIKATITKAEDERVEADLILDGEKFPLVIQKNEERNFDTSCRCSQTLHPLCRHKIMLFLQLLNEGGINYFDSIRNWDKEKNKLLNIYGYSLDDDLTDKFDFVYKDGKPFLQLLDNSIKRVVAPVVIGDRTISAPAVKQTFQALVKPAKKAGNDMAIADVAVLRLGLVFNYNHKEYPGFKIDAIEGEVDEAGRNFKSKIKILDLNKFVDTSNYDEADANLFTQIRKLQESEINRFVERNAPFAGIGNDEVEAVENLPLQTKTLIAEYIHPKLNSIFDEQHSNDLIFVLPSGKKFTKENLLTVHLSEIKIAPVFTVNKDKKGFAVAAKVKVDDDYEALSGNELPGSFLYMQQKALHIWSKPADTLLVEELINKDSRIVKAEEWESYLHNKIIPLSKEYHVDFGKEILKEVKAGIPNVQVKLSEKGDYLLFQPIYLYKGYETKPTDTDQLMIPAKDSVLLIKRDKEFEAQFVRKIQNLHSSFIVQEETGSLILKGAEVLKNNWFFLFVDAMKEDKVPVYGFEALKNFRFNTAKPTTHIHLSSGVDWFDASVQVKFGELKVTIGDIKKSLINKQSFVQLSDGSLGILPDEWLKKYSLLFKVGDSKSTGLRLSKYHMSVIDELYENRNEEELSFALDEKYERLREFKTIPLIEPPANVADILRPYQISGFQWLHYLGEVGWGGILADDMGLGKTLQALTMLSNYNTQNGALTALVVCPTTLIYNWRNEVEKFTPSLTHHIHHGSARLRNAEELTKTNIIITTYGTLRSDIQLLLKINFDYVILDESQAIKNPSSKVTKAATLLNAKNKLCMSGTPLQNNTFDIFAQMNFLNPGLLGSVEFFRNEFATPIDKFGELENKQHLRRLLMPFILRRTKEQVAKDLPEKTETILFCEMEKDQRRIYDAFRNTYRNKIMGAIDEQGIDKSQFTILQGLMKLRQICDSPAILNEDEQYPNHSIKLDEITREITENIGEHKALVFSQFLGMLALIRQKLIEEKIPYVYFDGSTSSMDREKAIQDFQNNDETRVFLISLKAGGVGLNLTAADYVYIVDPWWNPAVEQQAIDRTHRIGQTKNIFAYRMICVDTIEDKILQLQEKKKVLAKELISDESGFVKSLTKADVEYLFS